tara:strand:- start:1276 stop:1740 length:465 start_codon:yes stop_codon:yes gene_type:complete
MGKILPFGFLAVAAYYLITNIKSFAGGLKAKIGKISFNNDASQKNYYQSLVVNLQLVITNVSNLQGKIKGGNIDFILDDKIVGSINKIGEVIIQAKNDTIIPLQLNLNTLSLFPSIADLIRVIGKGGAVKLNVKGKIITSFGDVIINEQKLFVV